MENASKALLIAGAVLIVILLISLGIMMFRSSQGTTEQASNTANALESAAQNGVTSIRNNLGLE